MIYSIDGGFKRSLLMQFNHLNKQIDMHCASFVGKLGSLAKFSSFHKKSVFAAGVKLSGPLFFNIHL